MSNNNNNNNNNRVVENVDDYLDDDYDEDDLTEEEVKQLFEWRNSIHTRMAAAKAAAEAAVKASAEKKKFNHATKKAAKAAQVNYATREWVARRNRTKPRGFLRYKENNIAAADWNAANRRHATLRKSRENPTEVKHVGKPPLQLRGKNKWKNIKGGKRSIRRVRQ